MNLSDPIKLISLILAISISGERLVAFLKTLIPWLASPPPTQLPTDDRKDLPRQVVVMIIAFLACWLTAELAYSGATMPPPIKLPILGLLASGGSAFWTNILNYAKGVKDIKTQQGIEAKLKNSNTLSDVAYLKTARKEDLALQQLALSPQPPFKP